jgi:transcriptional regulator with XRE-family HTH domain
LSEKKPTYRVTRASPTVPASTPETAASRLNVGREARRWRRDRGLTLAQVGERSGLNVGYLSQIENDKAAPSLEALAAIAFALDVPPAWLLLDGSAPPRVVRASERPCTQGPAGGSSSEVDAGTSRDLRLIEVVVPPGLSTGVHAHMGDEHHIVLAGRFRMTQGEHAIEVGPGDYLAWDPTIPHDVECLGPEEGRMLIIYPRRGRDRSAFAREAGPDAGADA